MRTITGQGTTPDGFKEFVRMFPENVKDNCGEESGNIGSVEGNIREDGVCETLLRLLPEAGSDFEHDRHHQTSIILNQSVPVMADTLLQRFKLPCFAVGIFICYFLFGIFQEKM